MPPIDNNLKENIKPVINKRSSIITVAILLNAYFTERPKLLIKQLVKLNFAQLPIKPYIHSVIAISASENKNVPPKTMITNKTITKGNNVDKSALIISKN